MNSDTVNPMPATAATPTTPRHVAPSGSAPMPSRVASQVNAVMPASLPTTRPSSTPIVIGDVTASERASALIGTPALASANSGTITKLLHGCRTCSSHSTTETLWRAMVAVSRAAATDDRSVSTDSSTSSCWRCGRVGAISPRITPAIVACSPDSWSGEPEPAAHDEREQRGPHVEHAHDHQRDDEAHREEQGVVVDVVGVEDRDHDDRADVVDDRHGEEEQLEGGRDPAAEQAEDADRHRDVGGHRDAPAFGTVAAGVDRHVDQRRHDHPAEGGDGGERRPAGAAQLALDQLALDLEADDEEEDGHQTFVDPLLQVEIEGVIAEGDGQIGVPEVEVGVLPRRVRPDQGDHRGDDEDDAAGGLGVEELAQRRDDARAGPAVLRVGCSVAGHQLMS